MARRTKQADTETAAASGAAATISRSDQRSDRTAEEGRTVTPAAAAAGSIDDPKHEIRVSLLTDLFYHGARRDYLERMHRTVMFVVVAFGTAAVAGIISEWRYAQYAFAVPAVAAALDLVFNFMPRANLHADLYRRAAVLLADVESETPTEARIKKWRAALQMIVVDEPPQLHALTHVAYNAACRHVGKAENQYHIPWHHRALKNLWAFDGTEYKPRAKTV